MNQGVSKYAGVAAAFVFGVGLLFVGKVLAGVGVLGMATYALAATLSSEFSTKALLTAITAIIWSGFLAYQAAGNEITGNAIYRHGIGRGSWTEPVTRKDSPAKFREATNLKWGLSSICIMISIVAFMFYRKTNESDAESFY